MKTPIAVLFKAVNAAIADVSRGVEPAPVVSGGSDGHTKIGMKVT